MDQFKKILLIQFRTDQSLSHEQDCFEEELLERKVELSFVNAAQEELDISYLVDVDGVILGGSGEFYLTKGHGKEGWREKIFNYLDYLLGANLPVLGVCLGSQLIALHQGGELTDSQEFHEVGSSTVTLKQDREKCDIFSNLKQSFEVSLAHQDTIVNLPEHFLKLASTEKVDWQAFKLEDKKVWGTLFHPELTRTRLRYRLELYPSYSDDVEKDLQNFDDTSYSTKILHNFMDIL